MYIARNLCPDYIIMEILIQRARRTFWYGISDLWIELAWNFFKVQLSDRDGLYIHEKSQLVRAISVKLLTPLILRWERGGRERKSIPQYRLCCLKGRTRKWYYSRSQIFWLNFIQLLSWNLLGDTNQGLIVRINWMP